MMNELDRLEEWLKANKRMYARMDIEDEDEGMNLHKIVVYDEHGDFAWDAVLENALELTMKCGKTESKLTAQNIVNMIEKGVK